MCDFILYMFGQYFYPKWFTAETGYNWTVEGLRSDSLVLLGFELMIFYNHWVTAAYCVISSFVQDRKRKRTFYFLAGFLNARSTYHKCDLCLNLKGMCSYSDTRTSQCKRSQTWNVPHQSPVCSHSRNCPNFLHIETVINMKWMNAPLQGEMQIHQARKKLHPHCLWTYENIQCCMKISARSNQAS